MQPQTLHRIEGLRFGIFLVEGPLENWKQNGAEKVLSASCSRGTLIQWGPEVEVFEDGN